MTPTPYTENNHFLCVRELWVRGDLYRRRADIVGFVNGLPLLFMELKNVNKDIRAAFEQNFQDYRDTIPHLFHHNALVVLAIEAIRNRKNRKGKLGVF
ncbi:MAG: type I restriction endonuclease [Desulfobacterium sp.]|jgi:type I restriction enzyme R subunit|nr:type I restriction endonuclease [Desulfobacterium sp.]